MKYSKIKKLFFIAFPIVQHCKVTWATHTSCFCFGTRANEQENMEQFHHSYRGKIECWLVSHNNYMLGLKVRHDTCVQND